MKRLSLFSFLLMLFAVVLTSSCAKEVETNNVANLEVENRNLCDCDQTLPLNPSNFQWVNNSPGCGFKFKTEPNEKVRLITGCNEPFPGAVPTIYTENSDGFGWVTFNFNSTGYTSVNIIVAGRCITIPISSPC